MYFHPLILTEPQKQQRSAARQDRADLWFDGIDRQYWLHTDAVSEFAIKRGKQCDDQCKVAELRDHRAPPGSSCKLFMGIPLRA